MRRTELKRKTPMPRGKALVRTQPMRASVSVKVLRIRLCEGCRQVKFRPARENVTWCSDECGAAVGLARVAAQQARQHRAALKDSKPIAHWLELTERVVNHLVLVRDFDRPCISCDTRSTVAWQAGHYLSVGSHPELRFDLTNIHKQCHRCNVALSGNQIQYRLRLVPHIGLPAVERLEGPHPPAKFTREGLALIRKEAAAQARALKKDSR